MTIKEYVDINLPKSIRFTPEDKDNLFGLPKPYIIPCAADTFQEMFYWDTYFANVGLILRGDVLQAKNNVDNLLHLLNRFGFVLNGSSRYYIYNSQPPFLAQMTREVYEMMPDKVWLQNAYDLLRKEYAFWMTKRGTEIGLSRYCCEELPEDWIAESSNGIVHRLGFRPEGKTDKELAYAYRSSGECGWDLSPRFGWEGYLYAPVDLNCLLYSLEVHMAYFACELGKAEEAKEWELLFEERAARMRTYLKAEDNVFYDYHTERKCVNRLASAANFYPLFFGLATEEEARAAVIHILPRIEMEYGISTCEPSDLPGTYQWGYPNGWPPLQRMVVQGLLNYGYETEAKRIAQKYVDVVEQNFAETGHLWEKYNVVDGSVRVVNEYDMPAMLGWTFGTYYYCCEILGKEVK